MYFDWITWSIWLLGFTVLILWIIIPYREFRELLARRKSQEAATKQARQNN